MPRVKPTETIQPLVARSEFPLFKRYPKLVYLDSAATSQKPQSVIEAEADFYTTKNANVHRGMYALAEQATEAYEAVRAEVAVFIGGETEEIVFTKGTTEAINLVAQSFARPRLKRGHQIITTIAEHHANFVPWQQLAKETGGTLVVVPLLSSPTGSPRRNRIGDPVQLAKAPRLAHSNRSTGSSMSIPPEADRLEDDNQGELDLEFLEHALKKPTTLVAVADVGNVLGAINPTKRIVEIAHAHGVPVLVDAAQSLAHVPVSARRLGADFVVGSAHKLYGPTGVGFLWAKREHLEAMPPYQLGGDMIRSVSIEKTTWNDVPWKFEAGTPNIAGVVTFGAALKFFTELGWDAIANHEEAILTYLDEKLRAIDGVTILGPTDPKNRAGLVSFTITGVPPHDLATILDEQGVAIRAGFHCAEPLNHSLGLKTGSVRASVGVYTTSDDVDRLISGVKAAIKLFN